MPFDPAAVRSVVRFSFQNEQLLAIDDAIQAAHAQGKTIILAPDQAILGRDWKTLAQRYLAYTEGLWFHVPAGDAAERHLAAIRDVDERRPVLMDGPPPEGESDDPRVVFHMQGVGFVKSCAPGSKGAK